MKKLGMIPILLFIFVLTACEFSGITISFDSNEEEPIEAATTTEDEESEDDAEDTDEGKDAEDANETSNEDEGSVEDVASILQKSFEAMSELTSVHMSVHAQIHQVMGGDDYTEVKFADMTLFLEEPYGTYLDFKITSDGEDQVVSEVYEIDDFHYIHSSVHDVEWGVMPNPTGSQQLSRYIEAATLEEQLAYSDQFEVIEHDNEYWLSFTGTRDQAMSSVYGGVRELLDITGVEMFPEMIAEETIYIIIVDKDTYYVNGYEMYYKGDIPEDMGEYHLGLEQIITVDSHNDLSEFIVPQEVIDAAVPF